MSPLKVLFALTVLTGCANFGEEASLPDQPDAIPSGPGAISGEHGEFVIYSGERPASGRRRAAAVAGAQSRYGAVVSPVKSEEAQASQIEQEAAESQAPSDRQ
jgi:hypothetical protein